MGIPVWKLYTALVDILNILQGMGIPVVKTIYCSSGYIKFIAGYGYPCR